MAKKARQEQKRKIKLVQLILTRTAYGIAVACLAASAVLHDKLHDKSMTFLSVIVLLSAAIAKVHIEAHI
jgi:hypothetical protein